MISIWELMQILIFETFSACLFTAVYDCWNYLKDLAEWHNLRAIWVSKDCDIPGTTVKLSKQVSNLNNPLGTCKLMSLRTSHTPDRLKLKKRHTDILFKFTKSTPRAVIGDLTGHCIMDTPARHYWNIIGRSRREEVAKLGIYPALCWRRHLDGLHKQAVVHIDDLNWLTRYSV